MHVFATMVCVLVFKGGVPGGVGASRADGSTRGKEGGPSSSGPSSSSPNLGIRRKVKKRNQREGGALMPFNAQGTMGRKIGPPPSPLRRRSRPAASLVVSSNIRNDRDQLLLSLQLTLDKLKHQLSVAKAELREMEEQKQMIPPDPASTTNTASVAPEQDMHSQTVASSKTDDPDDPLATVLERKRQEVQSLEAQVEEKRVEAMVLSTGHDQNQQGVHRGSSGADAAIKEQKSKEVMQSLQEAEVQKVVKNNAQRIERKR